MSVSGQEGTAVTRVVVEFTVDTRTLGIDDDYADSAVEHALDTAASSGESPLADWRVVSVQDEVQA